MIIFTAASFSYYQFAVLGTLSKQEKKITVYINLKICTTL